MRALPFAFAVLVACGPPAKAPVAPHADEHDEKEEKITLDAVPAEVKQAALARYPDAKFHMAEKVTGPDNSIAYEIGTETGAGWKEATFKADGTFVEEE